MPADPPAKREDNPGLLTILHLPRLRQHSDKVLKISIIFDQPVVDEGVDLARCGILSQDGVEEGGVADGAHDQLVHPLGRPVTDKEEIHSKDGEKENRGDEKQRFNLHKFGGKKQLVIPVKTGIQSSLYSPVSKGTMFGLAWSLTHYREKISPSQLLSSLSSRSGLRTPCLPSG